MPVQKRKVHISVNLDSADMLRFVLNFCALLFIFDDNHFDDLVILYSKEVIQIGWVRGF